MSKKPNEPIIDAIRGRGPLSHSDLYWWMWDHYDDIQTERRGRADWVSATLEFTKLGFTGRKKAPLRTENVRKTWARVVRDKERAPTKPVLPVFTRSEHPTPRKPTPDVRMIPDSPKPTAPDDDASDALDAGRDRLPRGGRK